MIVVTGASGFIGRSLVADLRSRGIAVRPVFRPGSPGGEGAAVARLDHAEDWPSVLDGAEAVVHLAAHNPSWRDRRALADAQAFRKVNVEGTASLAEATRRAGVARFVFVSSARVYGGGGPFDETAECAPTDPYGLSKLEAERALKQALGDGATGWTILRPPVVYGPGRGGAIGLLDRMVRGGLPVPLAGRNARRSLVYLGNLISAIRSCLADERASHATFNVSDGPAPTYEELARLMAQIHGRTARFLPVPDACLRIAGSLPGPGPAVARLFAPLVCDDGLIRDRLDWAPPYSTAEGLELSFLEGANKGEA